MLPILISVSLAPGSYFFCAAAGPASATQHADRRNQRTLFIPHGFLLGIMAVFSGPSNQLRDHPAHQAGSAGRHQVDDQQQDDPVDRARQALRDRLGDVRDEQHEQPADQRAGDRGDAADHQADEQRDREHEGEAVRRNEADRDGAERARDAGVERAHAEGQRLVERDIDAHRARRDRMVADRDQRAAGSALHQIGGADIHHDRDQRR